jgi:CTP synthase
MGGTMRLGLRPTLFQEKTEWSKLRALYGEAKEVKERHRHRYEVNPEYIERLEKSGLTFIGKDDTGERMEIIELKDHPYFVGLQAHPEYLSRVLDPSKVSPVLRLRVPPLSKFLEGLGQCQLPT